jgi:hypothetical protein
MSNFRDRFSLDHLLGALSPEARNAYEDSMHFLKHCQSKPLKFEDLKEGDKFIFFPCDGDDDGHGGFQGGSYVFVKKPFPKREGHTYADNCFRMCDGNPSCSPSKSEVVKVFL